MRCWLQILWGFIMADKTTKAPRKTKEHYVREIEQLSVDRGLEWNRNNLKDKTTIPNLKLIISLLK